MVKKAENILVGISIGDLNGIGPVKLYLKHLKMLECWNFAHQ
jgi:hypothetical protein